MSGAEWEILRSALPPRRQSPDRHAVARSPGAARSAHDPLQPVERERRLGNDYGETSKSSWNPPRPLDRQTCRRRSLVERFIRKIKEFRRVATRCDKTARNLPSAVRVAVSRFLLRRIADRLSESTAYSLGFPLISGVEAPFPAAFWPGQRCGVRSMSMSWQTVAPRIAVRPRPLSASLKRNIFSAVSGSAMWIRTSS